MSIDSAEKTVSQTTDRPQRRSSWTPRLIGVAVIAATVLGLFLSPTPEIAGAAVLAMMLGLLFMRVPVAVSLAVPSIIGVYAISGIPAAVNILASAPYLAVSNWSMSVLPMFIFMDMLLTQSGMTTRIYRATEYWFGWLPGGLGIGTTAAGAGLSSVSGSTIGMTYTLARAGIPEMLKAGYSKRVAVGTVIVAGLPGQLIPPSILLVVYAGIASIPVGPQLIAGVVPGILLAVTIGVALFILGLVVPSAVGKKTAAGSGQSAVTWSDRLKSLRDVWGFPVILIVLFGGLFSGIFTPTEAGAAAALAAALLCLWYTRKTGSFRAVTKAAVSTVSATGAIFFILVGAEMLTRVLAITGLAPLVTDFLTSLGLSRIGFLIMLILFFLVLGMFFDTLAMLILTVPVLLPALETMGVDPFWFGVFVVMLGELAMVTPPVGILSYIVHGLTKDPTVNVGQRINLMDVFAAVFWFLPLPLLVLVVMIFVPDMVTWLPDMMGSS